MSSDSKKGAAIPENPGVHRGGVQRLLVDDIAQAQLQTQQVMLELHQQVQQLSDIQAQHVDKLYHLQQIQVTTLIQLNQILTEHPIISHMSDVGIAAATIDEQAACTTTLEAQLRRCQRLGSRMRRRLREAHGLATDSVVGESQGNQASSDPAGSEFDTPSSNPAATTDGLTRTSPSISPDVHLDDAVSFDGPVTLGKDSHSVATDAEHARISDSQAPQAKESMEFAQELDDIMDVDCVAAECSAALSDVRLDDVGLDHSVAARDDSWLFGAGAQVARLGDSQMPLPGVSTELTQGLDSNTDSDHVATESSAEKETPQEFESIPLPNGSLAKALSNKEWDQFIAMLPRAGSVDVNEKRGNEWTLLHTAAVFGNAVACWAILEHSEFTEANGKSSYDSSTALHDAAISGNPETCRAILDHPKFTEANAKAKDGSTALHYAAVRGNIEACRAIIEHSKFVEINVKGGCFQSTALHCAAESGEPEACRAILENHMFTEANATASNGWTALHCAARVNAEVCRAIIEHPKFTDAEAKACNGWTALHVTSWWGNKETFNAIREHPKLSKLIAKGSSTLDFYKAEAAKLYYRR